MTSLVKAPYLLRCVLSVLAILLIPLVHSSRGAGYNDFAAINGLEKISPALRGKLEQDSLPGPFKAKKRRYRLIVKLDAKASSADLSRAFSTKSGNKALTKDIKRIQEQVLQTMAGFDKASFKVLTRYKSLYGFSVEADAEGIRGLIATRNVRFIEEMPILYKKDVEAFNLTGTALAHLSGWTGKGTTIAIIDDGIDHDHAAFGGFSRFPNPKIIGGYDFADYDKYPTIDCAGQGHGTAVAGVAVGNGGGITGAAPDAELVFLKIQKAASCGQSRLDGDIIGAIDWVITNRNVYGIKVLSMSLGTATTSSSPCAGSVIADALVAAKSAGLVVVAASGNEAAVNGLSDPACHPDVVSVGAVYDADLGYAGFSICTDSSTRADQVPCYSNSADFLDILAPSHCATTAQAGAGIRPCFGGTSASTPYVAGVVATFFEKNPFIDRTSAINALVNTGDPVIDAKNGLIFPRVQHAGALESIDHIVPLANGTRISGLADRANGDRLFALRVPAGASDLTFLITGGSGDADLYVGFADQPTTSVYDCGATGPDNEGTCSFVAPDTGIYYVLLHGNVEYSGLTLQASYIDSKTGSRTTTVLTNGVAVTGLDGIEPAEHYFSLFVPVGAENLNFRIFGGSGDADLYVKYGSVPSTVAYDCRPFSEGTDEVCRFESPRSGSYYIMIRAFSSYSGVGLRGSFTGGERRKALIGPFFLLYK